MQKDNMWLAGHLRHYFSLQQLIEDMHAIGFTCNLILHLQKTHIFGGVKLGQGELVFFNCLDSSEE